MQNAWHDYMAVARTRLVDLGGGKNKSEAVAGLAASGGKRKRKRDDDNDQWQPVFPVMGAAGSKSQESDVEDVENALREFAKDKKIPRSVSESHIFRKPYFVSDFVPKLLSYKGKVEGKDALIAALAKKKWIHLKEPEIK